MRVSMCAALCPSSPARARLPSRAGGARWWVRSKVVGNAPFDEELDPSFTILDLKALISDSTSIPMEEMRVLHKGRAMHDEDTLEACGPLTPRRALPAPPQTAGRFTAPIPRSHEASPDHAEPCAVGPSQV
jgi:hypothetical protein